jgi:hypothetical protein
MSPDGNLWFDDSRRRWCCHSVSVHYTDTRDFPDVCRLIPVARNVTGEEIAGFQRDSVALERFFERAQVLADGENGNQNQSYKRRAPRGDRIIHSIIHSEQTRKMWRMESPICRKERIDPGD